MRSTLARRLNDWGNQAADRDQTHRATRFYRWAAHLAPHWSVPHYNLGLQAKYTGRWEESRKANQRATECDQADEAAWWNLGIAATALHDWREARRAWSHVGVTVEEGDEPWTWPPVSACVRLNPSTDGEVVWGDRIDPARMVLVNVPLPETGHRYHDVVLHDGAPNGHRMLGDVEVPVFDELELWQASSFATYEVHAETASDNDGAQLSEMCEERGFGVEDWSTIRILCAACSRGTPGPHTCATPEPGPTRRRFGIAVPLGSNLDDLLSEWQEQTGERCESVELVVPHNQSKR